VIQTKTPCTAKEPRKYFEKLLDDALRKLGVGCIDYLLSHSLRVDAWKARGGSSSGSRTGP